MKDKNKKKYVVLDAIVFRKGGKKVNVSKFTANLVKWLESQGLNTLTGVSVTNKEIVYQAHALKHVEQIAKGNTSRISKNSANEAVMSAVEQVKRVLNQVEEERAIDLEKVDTKPDEHPGS